ncbi:MAG: hypothetical protein ACOX1P_22050 [Thermoguttaceae bacterium]|jgi:hypothetical protein
MFKSPSSRQEDPLADRLRREALAARPEFSESLHQRLCQAVRARQAQGAVRPQRPSRRGRRRLYPAAAAAAVLVAAALVTWGAFFAGRGTQSVAKISAPAPPQAPRPSKDRDLAAIGELAEEANVQIAELLEQTAEWPQLARLDYWTSRAFSELRDRVPLDAAFSLALADTPGQPEPLDGDK